MPSERKERIELLQGTLDLIVLRALHTMGAQHAYGLAARLEQVAEPSLRLNQGTLYPALVRLEQKGWLAHTMPGARRIVPRACRRLLHTKASGTDALPIQHHVSDIRESKHVPPAAP